MNGQTDRVTTKRDCGPDNTLLSSCTSSGCVLDTTSSSPRTIRRCGRLGTGGRGQSSDWERKLATKNNGGLALMLGFQQKDCPDRFLSGHAHFTEVLTLRVIDARSIKRRSHMRITGNRSFRSINGRDGQSMSTELPIHRYRRTVSPYGSLNSC
jgi:hypothetical protein